MITGNRNARLSALTETHLAEEEGLAQRGPGVVDKLTMNSLQCKAHLADDTTLEGDLNMSELKAALEAAGITVKKYDPEKARPVYTDKTSLSVGKFVDELVAALGSKILQHPSIAGCIRNAPEMERLLAEYADQEGLNHTSSGQILIPQELANLTLNVDRSSKESGPKRFFCTNSEEIIDQTYSGAYYIDSCKISPQEAVGISRAVVPKYMPRSAPGVHQRFSHLTNTAIPYFNTLIPPRWERWRKQNPKLWNSLPAKPPKDVIRLIQHVIPNKEERNYFYAWLYTSMTKRAYVYLVLCGLPGVGKNRLKLLMRAMHGADNAADGKKETFGANQSKFNSQMEENTFLWFDELKYGPDMEPRMKEYQNDFISIERKGVDATRSTEIFCSMVISNNYPRDNYLLFNSRKFAPLVLGKTMLPASMTSEEINTLSEKLDDTHPRFDVKYVAQVAKWILTVGPKYVNKWPNLEYQGPKYWELAHTSMSRWQKLAALALTTQNARGPLPGWDPEKDSFLWSKTEEALRRKKEFDVGNIATATIRSFFETYCDREGRKVFIVEPINEGVMEDFWVKPIGGLEKVRGGVSLNSDGAHSPGTTSGGASKLIRPPGISQFQWRKMKAEWEATQGKGLSDVIEDEKDLL